MKNELNPFLKDSIESCNTTIKYEKEKIKFNKRIQRALESAEIFDKMFKAYLDYFQYIDSFPADDWDYDRVGNMYHIDYSNKKVFLHGIYFDCESRSYNELIDQMTKDDYIDSRNRIIVDKDFEFKQNGVTFVISSRYMANIPEEEMEILECLGKVNVIEHEAYQEKSVYCSNY